MAGKHGGEHGAELSIVNFKQYIHRKSAEIEYRTGKEKNMGLMVQRRGSWNRRMGEEQRTSCLLPEIEQNGFQIICLHAERTLSPF